MEDQTPAEYLESEFNALWEREGSVTLSYGGDQSFQNFKVAGQEDYPGTMISIKGDHRVYYDGAPMVATNALLDLSDPEITTLSGR